MAMNENSDAVGQLRRLLDKYVPAVASGVVQVRGIARKAGVRSIVVVQAHDPAVDSVGAVVGNRGSRIKPLVAELNYEKVDVVRWSDSLDHLIGNLIAPGRIAAIHYHEPTRQARITLQSDQGEAWAFDPIRLALASELAGWKLTVQ
jgi:transcription termination/antitermination protein NusA